MRHAWIVTATAASLIALGPSRRTAADTQPTVAPRTAELGEGLVARLDGTRLDVVTTPAPGEDWDALASRALLDPAKGPALESASGGGALAAGREVALPMRLWPAGLGARALLALFPGDAVASDGWHHRVTPGTTAWSLAVLFTGSGRNHDRIVDPKGGPPTLRAGGVLLIPADVLRPELHAAGASRHAARAAAASPASVPPTPTASRKPAAATAIAAEPPPEAAAPATPTIRGGGGLRGKGQGSLELVLDAARQAVRQAEVAQAHGATPPRAASSPAATTPQTSDDADPSSSADQDARDDEAAAAAPSTLVQECAPAEETAPAPDAAPPAPDTFVPRVGSRSDDGLLRYETDGSGPYAVYQLAAGETLYTHVVLRFTGLLSGREVNVAARRLAKLSGIGDVTDMRVGTSIHIPLADLLPQYLPKGHPRRAQWEQEQAESGRLARRERRRNLVGVHVILDSGHGGLDPGAGNGLAWEDDSVYDIASRVMSVLEDKTHAKVHPLVDDRSSGHAPIARLVRDTDEDLLTTPRIALEKIPTRVAVNLRWMMANDLWRKLTENGVSDDRIVFLSFHADSLHPSATGAMAYFAAAQLRVPSCGVPMDPDYRQAAEASDINGFEMTRRESLRAEGLSRELGEALIAGVRGAGLGVHGYGPVRGSIERGGLMVPAVLKYNRVPASVLVETCNLNNRDDQRSLRDPVFRQRFAEAIVDGLATYFEGHESGYHRAGGR